MAYLRKRLARFDIKVETIYKFGWQINQQDLEKLAALKCVKARPLPKDWPTLLVILLQARPDGLEESQIVNEIALATGKKYASETVRKALVAGEAQGLLARTPPRWRTCQGDERP